MKDLKSTDGYASRNIESSRLNSRIRSYHDLDVYQNSYKAMLAVYQDIIPKLPRAENDLTDQLRRSCKAVPRLIAEGHSKRHQVKGFQKYIDDAMAEANETAVSLCQVRDLCGKYVDVRLCGDLIDQYDKISRQLYKLAVAWGSFEHKRSLLNNSATATD